MPMPLHCYSVYFASPRTSAINTAINKSGFARTAALFHVVPTMVVFVVGVVVVVVVEPVVVVVVEPVVVAVAFVVLLVVSVGVIGVVLHILVSHPSRHALLTVVSGNAPCGIGTRPR